MRFLPQDFAQFNAMAERTERGPGSDSVCIVSVLPPQATYGGPSRPIDGSFDEAVTMVKVDAGQRSELQHSFWKGCPSFRVGSSASIDLRLRDCYGARAMPKRLSRPEWERFLKGRHVAVLGTVGPGGEPVLTPIWYLFREGKILMRTGKDSAKAKNIAKDARATVCVQEERVPNRSVTIYGRAMIAPEEAGLGATMARHYLGAIAGAAYMRVAADRIQQGEEITLIVTPERVLTQDFSAETPLVGRIWLIAKRLLPPSL